MTVTIKTYRFDLPPPSFAESNYTKGHWPITYTSHADLADYPDQHEVIGVDMVIDHRIYDGDNIHFRAKYFNQDTGELIFQSDQDIPDPGLSGYTYWNRYRIASWIGHWIAEISGPMNIEIRVLVTKKGIPISLREFVMIITETLPPPPPPPEVPDFWDSPLVWIQYFVISTMDTLLGWTGGSFVTLLHNVKSFLDHYWADIAQFFYNVSGNIQAAMSSTISGIQNWLDTSFSDIGAWWDSTTADIGEWWNTSTQNVAEWFEGVSGTIGDIITHSWEDVTLAVQGAVEGFVTWGEDLLTDIWEGIQGWVIDLITGLIESFNSGFDQGIEDQKNLRKEEEE